MFCVSLYTPEKASQVNTIISVVFLRIRCAAAHTHTSRTAEPDQVSAARTSGIRHTGSRAPRACAQVQRRNRGPAASWWWSSSAPPNVRLYASVSRRNAARHLSPERGLRRRPERSSLQHRRITRRTPQVRSVTPSASVSLEVFGLYQPHLLTVIPSKAKARRSGLRNRPVPRHLLSKGLSHQHPACIHP